MKKRILAIFLTAAMVIGLFTGCGSKEQQSASAEQTSSVEAGTQEEVAEPAEVVRVGVSQYNFPTLAALNKGFFEEEFGDDVTLEVSLFSSGVTIIEAINSGDLDFGFWGDFPEVTANANNDKIKLFAASSESTGSWANLYVQPDSGIETISDLKGHTIAFTVGTNSHKLLEAMLEGAGLTDNDVELISLSAKDIAATFLSDNADACILSSRTVIDPENATTLATSEDYMSTVIYLGGNSDFAEANPNTTSRFLQVLQKASEWVTENPEEAAAIAAEFDDLDVETELAYLSTYSYGISWTQEHVDAISSTAEFSLQQGNIEEAISVDRLYDDTYIKNAGLAE